MWSQRAPADDIIVVSEIGEQWSPQTAPARQADIPIIPSSLPTGKIEITIGIRIPKVPQEVPVAKAIRQATINIIAGFVPQWYIVLPIGIVLTIGTLFVIKLLTAKKAK